MREWHKFNRGQVAPVPGTNSSVIAAAGFFGVPAQTVTFTIKGLPLGYSASVGEVSAKAENVGTVEVVVTLPTSESVLKIADPLGREMVVLPLTGSPPTFEDGSTEYLYVTPLAEWLFSRLTDTMQARDAVNGGHLEQLTKVLGVGITEARDSADNIVNLIDVDTCPADFLPHLGALLGFEFPYDLDEQMQRNFIRSIVSLYRVKGTPMALQFVVNRIIAGKGFKLDITNEDYVGKSFDVRLSAEDTAEGSDSLQNKVVYLVGLYSPAGFTPTVVVAFYYQEQQDATRQSDTHTTKAYVRWSYNQPGHSYNKLSASGKVAYTNQGVQVLTI